MIKYHSHEIEPEYDPVTYMLIDNWDPNQDYGNEYVDVHFRINTPTYQYDMEHYCPHWTSEAERDIWNKKISILITSFGIIKGCESEANGKAYLFAHPQDISGEILKNDVKRIAEAINDSGLSSLEFVELYETIYNITDEEYEEYLETKRNRIRYMLFERSHTNRRNQYYYLFDVARNIAGKVRLRRLGLNDGRNYGSGQTIEYIMNIAKELADEGYVKIVQNEKGYEYIRSLNKTEFKKSKLKPLEVEVV